jgi:lysophospholipase L1-like esterase
MKLPKTWITIALFCLLAAVPYFMPSLGRFRFLNARRIATPFAAWNRDALNRVFLKPRLTINPQPAATTAAAPPPSPTTNQPVTPSLLAGDYIGKNWPVQEDVKQIMAEPPESVSIRDFGCVMSHFYSALALTEQKQPGAITRISHFGDSPISGDLISGEARTMLQDKFGDSGHGFILVSKPWDFYYHENVLMEGKGWKVNSPVLPGGGGGEFGLGGVSFTADSSSASSTVRTTSNGEGAAVSRFDIFYRAQPQGGSFLASVDREAARKFSTQAETKASAMASISVQDGSHSLTLTPQGDGLVTLYGVALERTTPGVVYDTLGLLGGTVRHLTLFREAAWIEDLENRKPDLVILNFGTNESSYGYLGYPDYIHNYSVVIQRIRAALPHVSILIMSPMDRAARNDDGDIVTIPAIPILVATQQRVARTEGVAFFNTFTAMGGMGTMARWYDDQPRLVTGDFTHPTYTGAQQVGTLLVNALLEGFTEYKRNAGSQPCTPAAETTLEQKAVRSRQRPGV